MHVNTAAFLVADFDGYGQTGEDSATLRRLRAEIFDPSTARPGGRADPHVGPAWIVRFPSARYAVEAALRMERRLAEEGAPPLGAAVHIGDVFEAGAGLFGDAVNAAAGMLTAAGPGALTISDAAYRSLDATLQQAFEAAGDRWTSRARDRQPGANAGKITLAFRAVASDAPGVAQLSAAIIGDLSRNFWSAPWLQIVVGAEAAYSLSLDLTLVGQDLKLDAVLTGADGAECWRGGSAGHLETVLAWRETLGAAIADPVFDIVHRRERARLDSASPQDMSAEDCVIAAHFCCQGFSPAGCDAGLAFSSQAVELAPAMPDAYASAFTLFFASTVRGGGQTTQRLDSSYRAWIAASSKLDHDDPHLSANLAIAAYRDDGDTRKLKAALDEAIGRAPFDFSLLAIASFAYVWIGEPVSVLDITERALRLGRRHPLWAISCAAAGRGLVMMGQYEAAIKLAREGLRVAPTYGALDDNVAAGLGHLGRLEEAAKALIRSNQWVGEEHTIENRRRRAAYIDNPATRRFFDGLRLAGLPES